ncbi:MAG TPA: hypothetical protein VF375_05805 [Candidatus Limnocylindrales bacterium]
MFRRRDRREDPEASESQADAPVEEAELDDAEPGEAELGQAEPGDLPEDMTADLDSQAADYLADNDAWMYGPNADAVLEILDRLEEIGPDDARPIVEAWQAIPKSDRVEAKKAVRKLTENDEELLLHYQNAREQVGTWMAVTGPFPEFVNAEPDWPRLCSQVGEAALDAATAVILEGKLDESHYESLLEPWSETTARLDAEDDAGETVADDDLEDLEDDDLTEEEGKFGPNSDSITDFLNRLWLLSPEQVGRIVSGWQNTERKELKKAHEALIALVGEDPEWREQVKKAQEELAPWLNAGRIQEGAGFLGQTGQSESRKMAGPTLADAVAALVLGDLLEPADADTLYGPWFNLIGAPLLPVAADDEEPEAPAKVAKKAEAATNVSAKTATKPVPAAKLIAKLIAKPIAKAAPATKSVAKPIAKAATKSTTTGKSTKK